MPDLLPPYTTPKELAKHLGVSERTLKEKVRKIGACLVVGKKTLMTDADVKLFMQEMRPCPSQSKSAAKSGITAAPLPEGDYAALQALRTKSSRSGSRRKKSTDNGNVVSMAQARD